LKNFNLGSEQKLATLEKNYAAIPGTMRQISNDLSYIHKVIHALIKKHKSENS
jgi:hypothetical protein